VAADLQYGVGDLMQYLLAPALDPRSMPPQYSIIKVDRTKNAYWLRSLVTQEVHLEPKEILDQQYKRIRSTQ